ncbi:flagellar hook-length control protein FliK [Cupriavidus taiwanensis]|uniref:Flagellar hook-length control protein-like C-terminal domain-containing protein n=1 Tax=Cupriavidus taiwanensis TaxID=164546 RepID=A0A975XEV5_9BURK|nr:conserved hypothetical protein [Cupriavidus taiwanensis]
MTGILLLPGLAAGQAPDAQALRPALAIDKLAALLPVPETTESGVQNSTGQAVRNSQHASGPAGAAGPSAVLAGTSTRESLSAAARAILAVMDGTENGPVQRASPLLGTAPSPASVPAAAAALSNAVSQSGLFYESHLAQWFAGARALPGILQEPQATVPRAHGAAASTGPAPSANGTPAAALLTYGGAATAGEPPRSATPALIPASQVLAEALASPRNPRVGRSHAAAERALRDGAGSTTAYRHAAAGDLPLPRPSAASLATQAYQTTADAARAADMPSAGPHGADLPEQAPADAARQTTPAGPAIHPATEGLVRQQLELLASQQFRLAGEAWPGVPLEWDLRRSDADGSADAHDGGARPWTSRMLLQLPGLGAVEALLTLGPAGLEARVATTESDIAARFIAARPLLRSRLEAQGIALQRLDVQTRDTLQPGAQHNGGEP